MTVHLIYAATQEGVIGSKGKLPWHLSEDLKRFKNITTDHVVVMGSKTYFSIPGKKRPLRDRTNVVLTKDVNMKLHDNIIMHSLEEVLERYRDREVYVIGGGQILKQAMPLADRIHLTLVLNAIKGDVYAPLIDQNDWEEISKTGILQEGFIQYQYIDYRRRSCQKNE